jgi:putative membrane protein
MVHGILAAVCAVAGAVVAALLACVPGLHVYNVLGFLVLAGHYAASRYGVPVPPEVLIPLSCGLITGYATVNTIPSVFLAAPDESALFTVLPGQKYLLLGRGFEAVMLTAAGSLIGVMMLVILLGPAAPAVMPMLQAVFQKHTHWILWCVIAFMLMSEWPKGGQSGPAGWRKLLDGWRSTGVGLITFALSGLLGFVLLYRSPIPVDVSFQNLMPAFVGLFTVPWLLLNLATRVVIPPQRTAEPAGMTADVLLKGSVSGALGGGFAAFFPVVTGGVGGLLAGHATAVRDDRVFLVSQGASKLVYYAGAFLLFFVPGQHLGKGGAVAMIRGLYDPHSAYDYYLALGSLALAGAASFLVTAPLTRATIRFVARFGYRTASAGALAAAVGLVAAMTGLGGLAVMIVAAGIGTLPVLHGSRRMNCLGVILLPMACNMSGFGGRVAEWLGLI